MKSLEERQFDERPLKELRDSFTKDQAAEMLQVSSRQVQRYVAEGKLRASRLSHKVLRIRRKDLEQFMERSRA